MRRVGVAGTGVSDGTSVAVGREVEVAVGEGAWVTVGRDVAVVVGGGAWVAGEKGVFVGEAANVGTTWVGTGVADNEAGPLQLASTKLNKTRAILRSTRAENLIFNIITNFIQIWECDEAYHHFCRPAINSNIRLRNLNHKPFAN